LIMTATIDHKILEALGLPLRGCVGFTMDFRPGAEPTVSVHYVMDAAQSAEIAEMVCEYKLVRADHA